MNPNSLCPQCGNVAVPYARYLKEMAGSPSRISKCGHCQVELRRNPAIYTLLSVGSVFAVFLSFFAAPRLLPAGWNSIWMVLFLMVGSVFALNFLGWLLVGWRVASIPSSK